MSQRLTLPCEITYFTNCQNYTIENCGRSYAGGDWVLWVFGKLGNLATLRQALMHHPYFL